MIVSFDTNIIVKDFWMKGHDFNAFFDLIKDSDIKVILSKVVLDEAIQKYSETIKEVNAKLSEYNRKYFKNNYFEIISDLQHKEYATFLKKRIAKINPAGTNIVYPLPAEYEAAYKRVLQKKPPAKNNGDGFRDALIWETMKREWKIYYHDGMIIHFITRDNDYKDTLIKEATSELSAESSVKFYSSLQEFNKSISQNYLPIKQSLSNLSEVDLLEILRQTNNKQILLSEVEAYFASRPIDITITSLSTRDVYRSYTSPEFNIEVNGKLTAQFPSNLLIELDYTTTIISMDSKSYDLGSCFIENPGLFINESKSY